CGLSSSEKAAKSAPSQKCKGQRGARFASMNCRVANRMKSRTSLLKLTLHSFAFALLLMLLGCPGGSNRPEVNSAMPESAKGKKSEFDGYRAFEYLKE